MISGDQPTQSVMSLPDQADLPWSASVLLKRSRSFHLTTRSPALLEAAAWDTKHELCVLHLHL